VLLDDPVQVELGLPDVQGPGKVGSALRDCPQGPAGLAGVIPQGGGDADSAAEPQDGDSQVAQGCHDLWLAGGADTAGEG
jgi:hypothetical protein